MTDYAATHAMFAEYESEIATLRARVASLEAELSQADFDRKAWKADCLRTQEALRAALAPRSERREGATCTCGSSVSVMRQGGERCGVCGLTWCAPPAAPKEE